MRIPLLSLFTDSPFEGLLDHAKIISSCAAAFQQAIECYVTSECPNFEDFRNEVEKLENEADSMKRKIRRHLPKGTLMPVDKFQFFRYLREQDHVIDAMQDVMDLISYRTEPEIQEDIRKDLSLFIDKVLSPVDELGPMVEAAQKYFTTFSERDREQVKEFIRNLRKKEKSADQLEHAIKKKILNMKADPITVFHLFKIVEAAGAIADHSENAGDMMRAMIAK